MTDYLCDRNALIDDVENFKTICMDMEEKAEACDFTHYEFIFEEYADSGARLYSDVLDICLRSEGLHLSLDKEEWDIIEMGLRNWSVSGTSDDAYAWRIMYGIIDAQFCLTEVDTVQELMRINMCTYQMFETTPY